MTEKRPMQPKIKITGVSRLADIEWVNIAKPDFAGFIFAKSHNRVTLEQAEFLRRRLDPDIKVVGIFSNTSFWLITELLESGIIDVAHLHENIPMDEILQLRRMTDKPLIKTIFLHTIEDIEEAQHYPVDYLMYDCPANENDPSRSLQLLAEYGPQKRKFFISDHLCQQNFQRTIQQLHPYGVNLEDFLERKGQKDLDKIHKLIHLIREI